MREPLLWGAADTFDLVRVRAALALYRERSVSREAASPRSATTN